MAKKTIKQLANLIEANLECKFVIDNDTWWIEDKDGNELASSDNYYWDTQWYGPSSNYGFGLAEALVELLNRKGFKISASGV